MSFCWFCHAPAHFIFSLQAGEKLACLSKTECSAYVLILKTSVEEICQGLECDLDLQEQLLWQQNMHTLILYGLIKKTYKMEEKKNGMPVFSSLDVLVQVLPKFSKHLYFELVKDCAWEHLMVDVSRTGVINHLFSKQMIAVKK